MILLLDGTSDSRGIAIKLKKDNYKIIATATTYEGTNKLIDNNISVINKKLLYDDLIKKCKKLNIDTIIDATHPYAYSIHENSLKVAMELNIKFIRYERKELNYNDKNIIYVNDYSEIENAIKNIDSKNIMVTTGIKNIEYYNNIINNKNVYFRILPDPENIKKLFSMDVKMRNIIAIEGPFTEELNEELYKNYNIDTLITKDSGFDSKNKIDAAIKNNIKVIIIKRKKFNYNNIAYNYEDLIKILKGDKNI